MLKIFLALAILGLVSCVPTVPVQPTPQGFNEPTIQLTPVSQSLNLSRVVVIGLDNYHIADIQKKMPNLWAFIQRGAYAINTHHTGLLSRSAPGFASIASGQYHDRHGVVNNTFILNSVRAGFAYWENLAKRNPPTFISDPPWVAFNRAGWDVGAIGWQGLVLEDRAEASAYLGRDVTVSELDQYWGIAIHRKDGKLQAGVAEIPELRAEFADGWKNGWAGPPRKQAPITLAMATTMLKANVPFLFVYVENTHGRCGATPPCQSDLADGTFDDMLQADDAAFGKFFSDLEKINITTANTLFVITTDEQDRYLPNFAQIVDTADLQPSIAGSGGLFYGADADAISAALAARKGVQSIVTREAIKALHIANSADARTPTIVAFTDADYIFNRGACSNCTRWNHGTVHPDITDSWVAFIGPSIKRGAITAFSDHADIIPTIRAALGLLPAPDVDGVPIFAALDRATSDDLAQLRDAFKQLNAPLGKFGMSILQVSTNGARGGTSARAAADVRIRELAARRDALIAEMRPGLDGATQLSREQVADLLKHAQVLLAEAAR